MQPLSLKKQISRTLLNWFRKNQRDLPWRLDRCPYRIWISEIMLQQTTVTVVIDYFNNWMEQYPDISYLAEASDAAIMKSWEGLGYYSRARNIKKSADIIQEQFEGVFPAQFDDIRSLPGIGDYTSAAIISQAFSKPYPAIDANVRRIFMRIFEINDVARHKYDPLFLDALKDIISKNNPGDFNQSLMELGALICTPKKPSCLICPISEHCKSYSNNTQNMIPHPKKKEVTHQDGILLVLKHKNKVLIQKPAQFGLFADLWSFYVQINIDNGINSVDEIMNDLFISPEFKAKYLKNISHAYTRYQTLYACYIVEIYDFETFRDSKKYKWIKEEKLNTLVMSKASANVRTLLF